LLALDKIEHALLPVCQHNARMYLEGGAHKFK
jgi:hypothetical protein